MRIYLTSVEETKHLEQIQKMAKTMFPKYSVKVIPSDYANEERREAIKAYRREYHKKNKEMENQKKREYDKKQRDKKQAEKNRDKKEKNETNDEKKEQKTKQKAKRIQKSEKYAKDFAEYIITREYELNEANEDKQFCKKYCERYCR